MLRRLLSFLVVLPLVACDLPGECVTDADCEDRDACTTNVCEKLACVYKPVTEEALSDSNACTRDFCHPTAGVQHVDLDVDDGDPCTADACDGTTGAVTHVPVAEIDDTNACTIDRCDSRTGTITHTPRVVDDGDACTQDLCDTATGVITHPAVAELDDEDACTVDLCNSRTGVIDRLPKDGIDDGDKCTVDGCDPDTGVIGHAPLASIDDGDACTVDACDAAGTVTHTPKDVDDDIDCTVDACNSATGAVSHAANDAACGDADGRSCSVPRCNATLGCVESPDDSRCNDNIACTTGDRCDPALGDPTTGCVVTPDDTRCAQDDVPCTIDTCVAGQGCRRRLDDDACADGEYCFVNGCAAVAPDVEQLIITEFLVTGANEFLELRNVGPRDGVLLNGTIANLGGQIATIRPVSDINGVNGLSVLFPAGEHVYGVPNPGDPARVPAGATFVYGDPGQNFAIQDTGDVLLLSRADGTALDTVDFFTALPSGAARFNGDDTTPLLDGQFPGLSEVSTQLDPSVLTAAGNDDGSRWCLGLRAADSRGRANPSCGGLVINEVLYDFDHPTLGASDAGRVFVEIAGPPGASLQGVRLVGSDGVTSTPRAPDVTFGAGSVTTPARLGHSGLVVVADGDANDGTSHVPNALVVLAAGDLSNGGSTGAGLRLLAADGSTLDAVGIGALATIGEGASAPDLDPDSLAVSLARDAISTDTNDNAADFHFDPTPTPGRRNAPVVPTIVAVNPVDEVNTATAMVRFTVRDFADFDRIDGASNGGNDVVGTIGAYVTPDGAIQSDGCRFASADDEGRGDAVVVCPAPPVSITGAVPVSLANPPELGTTPRVVSRTDAFRYTQVANGTSSQVDGCRIRGNVTETLIEDETKAFEAWVKEQGYTNTAGASASVKVQFGTAAPGVNPTNQSGWTWVNATYANEANQGAPIGSDVYRYTFTAPAVDAPVQYAVGFRTSIDGGTSWTYCDFTGAGSESGAFAVTDLVSLTVNPFIPPPDTDGDGIIDDLDACDTEAEDFDGDQDTDGCRDPDDPDGDGIFDATDLCPLEPEDFDADRDDDGCPEI